MRTRERLVKVKSLYKPGLMVACALSGCVITIPEQVKIFVQPSDKKSIVMQTGHRYFYFYLHMKGGESKQARILRSTGHAHQSAGYVAQKAAEQATEAAYVANIAADKARKHAVGSGYPKKVWGAPFDEPLPASNRMYFDEVSRITDEQFTTLLSRFRGAQKVFINRSSLFDQRDLSELTSLMNSSENVVIVKSSQSKWELFPMQNELIDQYSKTPHSRNVGNYQQEIKKAVPPPPPTSPVVDGHGRPVNGSIPENPGIYKEAILNVGTWDVRPKTDPSPTMEELRYWLRMWYWLIPVCLLLVAIIGLVSVYIRNN